MIRKTNANSVRMGKNKNEKRKKKAVFNKLRAKKRGQNVPFNVLSYDRQKDLPRLIAIWPSLLEDDTQEASRKIIEKIQKALQTERRKSKTGHWSYNLTKHIGLLTALKAEQTSLQRKNFTPKTS